MTEDRVTHAVWIQRWIRSAETLRDKESRNQTPTNVSMIHHPTLGLDSPNGNHHGPPSPSARAHTHTKRADIIQTKALPKPMSSQHRFCSTFFQTSSPSVSDLISVQWLQTSVQTVEPWGFYTITNSKLSSSLKMFSPFHLMRTKLNDVNVWLQRHDSTYRYCETSLRK